MKKKHILSSAALRKLEGSLFIAPWAIGFLAFVAFPLLYSFYMTFHQVKIIASGITYIWVGLQYYREILLVDGGLLYNDLLPFLKEMIMMIPIIVVFSLLVGILLNQKLFGRTFFRSIFFLPVIFSSGQVINEFISQGGGTLSFVERFNVVYYINTYLPEAWGAPIANLISSFVMVLWYSGMQIVIIIAGRQTIPASVYESARIDGAGSWETFWKITLPGLSPFIFLNLIYTVVDLFTFPENPIISKVNTSSYGISSALAWIYLTIVLSLLGIIFLIYNRVTKLTAGNR
ncbi:L-arabinose transport system permease protein AraP [Ruminiclostridium hungatei]|uniref:L-arabinose transport system permease protein AraP n=1 Tax=Ruminiclostridium hungatei TaxID=48256 RepID=A0A1V4SP03_RUMHU|nr:sugar ABC transporter permease [Ruminiclostridium hungatei]OPX44967.1 L-arabinose transport system permease protein AraP [Ruminiclostridium hungatei]